MEQKMNEFVEEERKKTDKIKMEFQSEYLGNWDEYGGSQYGS